MKAEGTFEIAGWEENTLVGLEGGRKITRADVEQTFSGDLDGTGSVQWQMAYREDGTAEWLGMQHITGTIGGGSGSFVLRSWGTFDGATASGEWAVVEGAGTGDLASLTGSGTMRAPIGSEASYHLDYER